MTGADRIGVACLWCKYSVGNRGRKALKVNRSNHAIGGALAP